MFLVHFRGPAGTRRALDPPMEITAPMEITTPHLYSGFYSREPEVYHPSPPYATVWKMLDLRRICAQLLPRIFLIFCVGGQIFIDSRSLRFGPK